MKQAGKGTETQAPRTRLARRFLAASSGAAQRRRAWTMVAVVLAALLGYHALFGANGVFAYRAKRAEDRQLARQLEQMNAENSRLQAHVQHLKNDPDAIEYEAHVRLRYTRPDQVIVLNNDAHPAPPAQPQPAPTR